MQLKAAINKMAKEKHIPAQLVMQNYMLERLLERIAHSRYQGNFILKGGLLIASMVGLHSRATMDMDATIRNHPVNENSIKKMFEEIVTIPINDDITFSFQDVGEIRKNDAYGGYRISLTANFLPMKVPLKLDITTGDKITPKAVEYKYPMMFNDGTLEIFAYNLETILAVGDCNFQWRSKYTAKRLLRYLYPEQAEGRSDQLDNFASGGIRNCTKAQFRYANAAVSEYFGADYKQPYDASALENVSARL